MPYGENLLVLILRNGPSALRLAISVEELLQLSYESASPDPVEVQPQLAAAEMVPTQPVVAVGVPSQPAAAPLPEPDLAEFVAACKNP
jgi:hypothetical protein